MKLFSISCTTGLHTACKRSLEPVIVYICTQHSDGDKFKVLILAALPKYKY